MNERMSDPLRDAGDPALPEVRFTSDPAHLELMEGRAALYQPAANTVFLNPRYTRFLTNVERVRWEAGTDPQGQQAAEKALRDEYVVAAGKWVTMARHLCTESAGPDADWQAALSMEALTVYLADPVIVKSALQRYRKGVNARWRRWVTAVRESELVRACPAIPAPARRSGATTEHPVASNGTQPAATAAV
jgi:hypothetical protein